MKAGELVAGRFELLELAGVGGMGSVFRALDRETGTVVAVKSVIGKAAAIERFRREAALLSELSHPAIVEHVAHGETEAGELYIAMEWLAGEDLATRLERGRLTPEETIAVGRSVAEALAAAHEQGIVHRDIKPSNLFLQGGDVTAVKLLDFGIARVLRPQAAMTQIGTVLGSPGYMSPEQARGDRELDARSDVFSLGTVLYECLSGASPFEADHVMGTLAKLILVEPSKLRDMGVEVMSPLDDLILKMLAKEPAARPQRAADVARGLAELDDAAPTARPRSSVAASGLTHGEQRLLSVLFVGAPPNGEDPTRAREALEDVLRERGGTVEMFTDGSAVVLLSGAGAATDQAARAAEHGLAVRAALPFAMAVLATGRGIVSPRAHASGADKHASAPVFGEVIDRAVLRLRSEITAGRTPSEALAVDEVTAGLLDARFEIGGDAGGLYVSRNASAAPQRTLLGRATPFVGRDAEMAALTALLEECAATSKARTALVTGAAGAGKSRLGAELSAAAAQLGFDVWIGHGDLVKNHGPFALIGRLVRDLSQIAEGEPLAVRRRKLRARVGRHLPRDRAELAADLLGEVSGTPFPDQGKQELSLARQNPVLLAHLVQRAFDEWVAAECDARPVLLVVEDLQWIDVPSANLLVLGHKNLADKRLAIVGLARSSRWGRERPRAAAREAHLEEEAPWVAPFRDAEALRIELPDLPASAGRELCAAVLGGAPEALLDAIVRRSGGNVFYLEELVRSVREGKGVASLPETVIAMIHARLEQVPAQARRVLRAASVFGDSFPRDGVVALLGGPDSAAEVDACLAELVERELLERASGTWHGGAERYAFRSALVREAAYAMLVDADRLRGHRLAAEWLESIGEAQAVVIAEHFERGGAPELAILPYRVAALQALAANDFRGAVEGSYRAVQCGASGVTLGEVLRTQADAESWMGQIADCARSARLALGHLERGGASWIYAAALLCVAEARTGQREAFRAVAHEILEQIPEAPPPASDVDLLTAQVTALSRVAVALLNYGDLEESEAVLARLRVRHASGALDDHPFLVGFTYRAFAVHAQASGDHYAAYRATSAGASCFERVGALRDACVDRGNAGFFLSELGCNADAEAMLLHALQVADALGLKNVAASARQNLSMVLSRRGAFREAMTAAGAALQVFEAQAAQRLLAAGRIYVARICLNADKPDYAERHALAAIEAAASAAPFRAYAYGALAASLLAQRRTAEALTAAERSLAELGATGAEEGEAFVRLAAAETMLAAGHAGDARALLAEARYRLLMRAERVTEPAIRESFLSGIPEHARTLRLAAELKPS